MFEKETLELEENHTPEEVDVTIKEEMFELEEYDLLEQDILIKEETSEWEENDDLPEGKASGKKTVNPAFVAEKRRQRAVKRRRSEKYSDPDYKGKSGGPVTTGKKVRLRKPETWECNKRKKAREHGEAYINIKKKVIPPKKLKAPCQGCKFQCTVNVPQKERVKAFNKYYSLSSAEKKIFLLNHTEMEAAKRHAEEKIRKQFSFRYFLVIKGQRKRVCKDMFLNTFAISSNSVYYTHKKKKNENVPQESKWGRHTKKVIDEDKKNAIRKHIESFRKIGSHYCTIDSKWEYYLDGSLSINKMYELYVKNLERKKLIPCKKHVYFKIFHDEYNYVFHKPKEEICERCYELKTMEDSELTQEKLDFFKHVAEKVAMRVKGNSDREVKDPTTVFLSFDMENVSPAPVSEAGINFYRNKLDVSPT